MRSSLPGGPAGRIRVLILITIDAWEAFRRHRRLSISMEVDAMATRLPVLDAIAGCCAPIRLETIEASAAAQLARQFAALADPVRLQLLSLLATSEAGT